MAPSIIFMWVDVLYCSRHQIGEFYPIWTCPSSVPGTNMVPPFSYSSWNHLLAPTNNLNNLSEGWTIRISSPNLFDLENEDLRVIEFNGLKTSILGKRLNLLNPENFIFCKKKFSYVFLDIDNL